MDMSVIDMPVPKTARARKVRFSPAEVETAVKLLKAGKTATIDHLFDDRPAAQVGAYYLREACGDALGVNPKAGGLKARTWEDEQESGRFRAAVQLVPKD